MALKYEIDSIDDLDEGVKSLYKKKGGKYVLDVDGIPKADNALEDRLAKLEANNAALLKEKKEAKEEAERVRLEALKKDGNVEAIEKSWQEKMTAAISAKDAELAQYQQMVSALTVGSSATAISAEVFGEHAELMMPHVNSRLTYEIAEGKPKVRVLGPDGKPSALSVDELKAEFKNNQKFAQFVVGTKANGAGQPGPGGGKQVRTMTRAQYDAIDPRERAAVMKEGVQVVDA